MQVEAKIEIVTAANAEQFEQARRLFKEYADGLDVDLCFQHFDEELENVETIYSAPTGSLLLAFCDERIAGCVALRKLEAETCEMKRLYVKPEFQSFGIGKKLVVAIIEKARKLDYERMQLDTLPVMGRAQRLYAAFGFKKISAYRYNPDPNTVFMELKLTDVK
jgi:N-acetylglutamate synthase-like GNAT family acetyltransferase